MVTSVTLMMKTSKIDLVYEDDAGKRFLYVIVPCCISILYFQVKSSLLTLCHLVLASAGRRTGGQQGKPKALSLRPLRPANLAGCWASNGPVLAQYWPAGPLALGTPKLRVEIRTSMTDRCFVYAPMRLPSARMRSRVLGFINFLLLFLFLTIF
jgi:hypothetical protein